MPQIEYVVMANHAEAINGLLYLQGAGWTDVRTGLAPEGHLTSVHLGIGISILVGWNETNTPFALDFVMVHEDGGEPVLGGQAQIEAGRPAGLPAGGDQRSVIAIGADIVFPRAGGYEFRATIGGTTKSVSFRVQQIGQSPPPPRGPAGPTHIPGLS